MARGTKRNPTKQRRQAATSEDNAEQRGRSSRRAKRAGSAAMSKQERGAMQQAGGRGKRTMTRGRKGGKRGSRK